MPSDLFAPVGAGHARRFALPKEAALFAAAVAFVAGGCGAGVRAPASLSLAPGAELYAQAVSRTGSGFAMIAAYKLRAEGLAPAADYHLELGYADGTRRLVLEDATVTSTGAVLAGSDDAAAEVELALRGMAPGEPLGIFLTSADGLRRAATVAIPRPIQAGEENGCRLVAQLERKPVLGYRVHVAGFGATEAVTVSLSATDRLEKSSNPIGELRQLGVFLPMEKMLADPSAVTLAAFAPSCQASVELDWSDAPELSSNVAPEVPSPAWQQPWPRKLPRLPRA